MIYVNNAKQIHYTSSMLISIQSSDFYDKMDRVPSLILFYIQCSRGRELAYHAKHNIFAPERYMARILYSDSPHCA